MNESIGDRESIRARGRSTRLAAAFLCSARGRAVRWVLRLDVSAHGAVMFDVQTVV